MTGIGFPALRAERVPRCLVRPGARRPGWLDRPRGWVGPSPPRPRRAGVHRPPGSDRAGSARLQPGDRRWRLSARPRAARRGRDHGRRGGGAALSRDRQPGASDRRVRGSCRRGDIAVGRGHAAVRDRVVLGGGRGGGAVATPVPGPAPRPDAPCPGAAARRGPRDAPVLRRGGVRGGRDAHALPLNARGGT